MPVEIKFLFGRAGTGKTHRCLSEAREELVKSCEGKPLLFLAPKQATYQLERALLAGELKGFSRLHIFSFERLAYWIFKQAGQKPPTLDAFGRQLIVQSLLGQLHKELKVYKSASSHAGFAEEICRFIDETTRKRISTEELKGLAANSNGHLQAKLLDLAKILDGYEKRLAENNLVDPGKLLDLATAQWDNLDIAFEQIWLDGFADLTPQELFLLQKTASRARKVTLAFCTPATCENKPGISEWNPTWKTAERTRGALQNLGTISIEALTEQYRFQDKPALQHLEANWDKPSAPCEVSDGLRLLECPDPETEATAAAHAILDHVRNGGRFREVAVLPRNLPDYSVVLKRVFLRYEIPFFLDARESVISHPLVRLIKAAMRLVNDNWERGNWLSLLKTGLLRIQPHRVELLENTFLGKGTDGPALTEKAHYTTYEYQACVVPLMKFGKQFQGELKGEEFARQIRQLWSDLHIPFRLGKLCSKNPSIEPFHSGVWKQLEHWLDQISAAFSNQSMNCRDWMVLAEGALNSLTIGLIPPALDQVLIGSIDRSRNPDLKLAIIPGCNDAVFPRMPSKSTLFTSVEVTALEGLKIELASSPREEISRERFLGYIAFTRAREALLVTYSKKGFGGEALQPSSFVEKLKKLFPKCKQVTFVHPQNLEECKHKCEASIIAMRLGIETPETSMVIAYGKGLNSPALSPESARKLFGNPFRTSISRLEDFAECNYRFFLNSGLRLREREENDLGHAEKGIFQHKLLSRFHERLLALNHTWHSVSIEDAKELIKQIAEEEADFNNFCLTRTEQKKFITASMVDNVVKLVEALITWMKNYSFEPWLVEASFGFDDSPFPGVEIQLEDGSAMIVSGKIDRIDLAPDKKLAVVIDYKNSKTEYNATDWHNGLQIQLPVYLLALQQCSHIPAAMFYIQIKNNVEKVDSRSCESTGSPYLHEGKWRKDLLHLFDQPCNGQTSGQVKCTLNKDGGVDGRTAAAWDKSQFESALQLTKQGLEKTARQIFSGHFQVNPIKEACDYCELGCICRIDRWTTQPRKLEKPSKKI